MRYRFIIGAGATIGLAAIMAASVPAAVRAADDAAAPAAEKSVDDQRKEMSTLIEKMSVETDKQSAKTGANAAPTVGPSEKPTAPKRAPRTRSSRKSGIAPQPFAPTTRPALPMSPTATPTTQPAEFGPPAPPTVTSGGPRVSPHVPPPSVRPSPAGFRPGVGVTSRPGSMSLPPPSTEPARTTVTEVSRPSVGPVNPQEVVANELLPATPTTQPSPEELLGSKSADKLPDVSDKELNELKERLKKSPTANVPAPPEDVNKEKDRWKIPPERRTYFFTWQDTPLAQCCEDFSRMTGLAGIGVEIIQAAKNVTYRSAEVMSFDQAMNEFNLILSQQQYWAVRQEKHLVIKKLTDWHRNIPQDRYYDTVAAYRAAKLPLWEVIGVAYECKKASPARLVEYVLDRVPDNTIRAGTVTGSNQVAITGPAYFVDQVLKHAEDFDKNADNDPREMKIYPVENIKPSIAVTIIRDMVDVGAVAGGPPRPMVVARPPGGSGAAPLGESPIDQVDMQPQDDLKKLIVRAMPEKQQKILECLQKIDVKREDDPREIKEITLKNIRPDDAINLIRPLITDAAATPAAPPLPPQPIPNEPPQQFQQRQQQFAQQMQAFQHSRGIGGGGGTAEGPQLYADNNRSVIIVRALDKDFAKIKELAERFDVPPTVEGAKIVKLTYLDANQTASVVQQVIGSAGGRPTPGRQPFMVSADPSGTALIVSGDRLDVTRAETLIGQLDVEQTEGAKDYVIKLQNAEPQTLANILQQKFAATGGGFSPGRRFSTGAPGAGLPRFIPDEQSKNLLVTATERQWPDIENLIKQFDVASETLPHSEVYKLSHAAAEDVVRMLQQGIQMRGGRRSFTSSPPQFSADARTNSILAVATDEYHKIAKDMIAQLDQPGYDELKEIKLEQADAEFVADQLKELLGVSQGGGRFNRGGEDQIRIIAEPMGNRLLVAAPPEKLEQARKFAAEIDANYAKAGYEERIFTLKHTEVREVSSILQSLYGGAERASRWSPGGSGTKTGGVKIMESEGAIVVHAPKAKMDKIAELVQTLETSAGSANEIRSWHLAGADVHSIARTIETMFPRNRRSGANGVDCTADDASDMLFVSAPADLMTKVAEHIETIKTNSPKESSFAVKYYPVANAKPEDVASAIEPIVDAKWQAEMGKRGGRSRSDMYASRPQIIGDSNAKRVMVAGSEDLMPMVEQLVREMDIAPEGGSPVIRFIQLKKGKAEDVAPIIQDSLAKSGGGSVRPRRNFWRNMYMGGQSGGGGASSDTGEVTVTPIPSSNSLLIRGPEQRVDEAMTLARDIDSEARPDGPMIKTYVLKFADVFEVQDTIEGLLGGVSAGGSSDYGSSDYGGSSMFASGGSSRSRSRRRGGGGAIIVTTDYSNNSLIVAADYDKIAQVDNLVQLKEAMAEAKQTTPGEEGTVVTRDGIMKTYQMDKADAEDVADQLTKILEDQFGFFEGPDVRAMKYTNSVVITAKPDQLKVAEGYLNTIVKNWQPKTVILVKQVEGVKPSKLVGVMKAYGGMEAGKPDIRPLIPSKPGDNPEDILRTKREIQFDTPITTQPASGTTTVSQFVPTGELARLRAELASITIGQTPPTRPAVTTQSARAGGGSATAAPTTRPAASPPAVAPLTTRPVAAPKLAVPATQVAAPVVPASHSVAPVTPAPTPAVLAEPAKTVAATPATNAATTPLLPAVPAEPDVMNKVADAATELNETGRPQVMFDDKTGMIMIVGRQKQVDELETLMESLQDQLGNLPATTDIRVFRLDYVDVNVAATILETMFNESGSARNRQAIPGQPGAPGQPGVPGQPVPGQPQTPGQQQARARDNTRGEDNRGRGVDEGSDRSGRRGTRTSDRSGEKTGTTGGSGPRPLLHGDRIRVFPDIRTRTLVVRAHPDDFRAIAELVLKIDRPSENPGIDIRIFQLKKLNAGEVEQALKAILKIDQQRGAGRRTPRIMGGGAGMPGMPGGWQAQTGLIEQLQEQMLELQMPLGEGKLAINPSEQITITSDATTNSVIVSAPDEGMKLIEKLIGKLEEQEIPLMVKTVKLEHADVGDIMPQLEKLFERGGGGGGSTRGGAGAVNPSRIGAVQIAADVRTNQLVVRALAPDFEKILPIIQNLDQKLDGQIVQTFTLQHADAASIASALKATYMSAGGKGTAPIRISSDASTNTLFVWADTSLRDKIAVQVIELDKKAQEKGETKQITLTQANAQVVADKLNAAFGDRGGRGRTSVKITGDSASGVLFVTAPQEIFKQIAEAAKAMDTQKILQIKTFKLQNAFATEVLAQMKDMTMQLGGQLRGRTDMQLDVFAATADARTNTIFVTGGAATLAIAEQVITQIDVAPSNPTAQITSYFSLTKADATSVAATINALYVNVPGKAVPPPKAYAEPVTNSVFVYATQPQLEQIKTTVIEPLEKAAPEAGQDIQMYRLTLKYAKVDDVLQTITQYIAQRRQALAQAGVFRNMRPQDLAISLTGDTNTNQLILSCNKKNYDEIAELIKTIDIEQSSAFARVTKIYPLRYADVSSASQAINQALTKPGTVGEKDRITVVPEFGTQSVVVTASKENLEKADKIVEDLDKDSITKYERHIVELKAAQADDVAAALTQAYAQRRATRQGDRPVTVVAESNTNKLIVSCTQTEFAGVKELIDSLDVPKSEESDRQIKTFRLQYAEAGSLVAAITQSFQARTGRMNPRDLVTATADYTTGTLIVSASKDRMKQVDALIAEMDREVEGASTPQYLQLKVANASQLALTLKQVFTDPAQQRRGRTSPEMVPVIIADERSNSLVVRARPADYNLIKQMVANMDTDTMGGAGAIRVIAVADGIDVESLATQIEKTMNEGQRQISQQTGTKPLQVSIGADRRTNALMVSGAPALFPEVEKLVAQLEKMKPPGGTGILIVPLRNVRPDDVKRVIDQMQQRRGSGARSSADWKDSELGKALRHSA